MTEIPEEEFVSPYCQQCEGCGHDGCCSFYQCFRSLVQNSKTCDNGETYLKDARFYYMIAQLAEEVMDKLEQGEFSRESAIAEYRKEWDIIYNKCYDNE